MKKYLVTVIALILCIASIQVIPIDARNSENGTVPAKNQRLAASSSKKKIKLNKKKATMYIGKKLKLKVSGVKGKKVRWSTSNKKVATVKKGIVKAKKKGKVTITAKVKGKKYKCKIKVKSKRKTVKYIKLPVSKETEQAQYLLDGMDKGKNIVISPLSLNYVLAMVANGSTPTAKAGLEKYLGDTTANMNSKFKKSMDATKKDSMLKIANSFWYRNGYNINSNFEEMLKSNYYADISKELFDESTVTKINQWTSDNTDGMIDKVIDEISPEDVAFGINAVLFQGKWTEPFEHQATSKEVFYKADNTKIKVDMMSGTVRDYYENDKAVGFEKTYGKNEEYSFIAILPKTKQFKMADLNLKEFLSRKTNEYKVYIHLPKFEYSWNDKLTNLLKNTEVRYIFNSNINPLGNMFEKARDGIYAKDILQSCKVIMDEEETKAAAVTIVIAECKSIDNTPTKTVNLNRPFAYIIKNNKTNEILFMGKVTDPTQKKTLKKSS